MFKAEWMYLWLQMYSKTYPFDPDHTSALRIRASAIQICDQLIKHNSNTLKKVLANNCILINKYGGQRNVLISFILLYLRLVLKYFCSIFSWDWDLLLVFLKKVKYFFDTCWPEQYCFFLRLYVTLLYLFVKDFYFYFFSWGSITFLF